MGEVDLVHGRRGDPGIALPRLFPRAGTAGGIDGREPVSGQLHPLIPGEPRNHESAARVHLRPRGGAPAPRFAPDDGFRRENVPSGGQNAFVFVVKVMVEIAPQGPAAQEFPVQIEVEPVVRRHDDMIRRPVRTGHTAAEKRVSRLMFFPVRMPCPVRRAAEFHG